LASQNGVFAHMAASAGNPGNLRSAIGPSASKRRRHSELFQVFGINPL
jgi:hypothetical protein